MTTTTIKTNFRRKLTVEKTNGDTYLEVKSNDPWEGEKNIKTYLPKEQVTELVNALVGENATVVTDLPKVTRDYGFVTAGGYDRGENADPAELVRHAKALLAIAANITAHKAEQEAAKAAEAEKEAKRDKRREELAKTFTGNADAKYRYCFTETKAGIDRLIAAEEAAQVS